MVALYPLSSLLFLQIPATAAGKTVGVVMMLSGALYMAMPLAIIGTKFDQAYQEHESEKLLKNKKWAENQMRRLQNVTRRTRRKRALHLGYQIAEEVGELGDWEETWAPLRNEKKEEDTDQDAAGKELQARHELLGDLFEVSFFFSPKFFKIILLKKKKYPAM